MFIAMFHLLLELKAYPIKYDTPVYKIYVDSPNLSTVIRRIRSSSNSGGNSGGTLVTNGDIHGNNSNSSNSSSSSKEKTISNYWNRNDGDSMRTTNIIGNQHGIKLHVSDGAYPVYYALAKVNGKFGKIIKVLEENEKLNKI